MLCAGAKFIGLQKTDADTDADTETDTHTHPHPHTDADTDTDTSAGAATAVNKPCKVCFTGGSHTVCLLAVQGTGRHTRSMDTSSV